MTQWTFNEFKNPPFDPDLCSELEDRLGIKFPASYLNILKHQNGGYPDIEYEIQVQGEVPSDLNYYLGEGFFPLYFIAGIWREQKSGTSLLYLLDVAKEWELPNKVIPICGDAHTWVAFDYRSTEITIPSVIFIETDEYKTFTLANSFDELLTKLTPSSEAYDEDDISDEDL